MDRRRAGIAELEAVQRNGYVSNPPVDPSLTARSEDIEQQMKSLALREADQRAEIAQIDESIQHYAADMNAEELGQKLRPTSSGKPGVGPRYEFAKRQKEAFEGQRGAHEAVIAQLDLKRNELREAQAQIAADSLDRPRQGTCRVARPARRAAVGDQRGARRPEAVSMPAARPASKNFAPGCSKSCTIRPSRTRSIR